MDQPLDPVIHNVWTAEELRQFLDYLLQLFIQSDKIMMGRHGDTLYHYDESRHNA